MGFFSRFKIGSARIGERVSGTIAGASSINTLRSSVQSYYGRELLDDKQLIVDLKRMHVAAKHCVAFNEKRISKLMTKSTQDPKRFNDEIHFFITLFTRDLGEFALSYADFLQKVNDKLVNEVRQEVEENSSLSSMLTALVSSAKEGAIMVPGDFLRRIEKEVALLVTDERRAALKEVKLDTKELAGKEKTFWSPSGSWAAHKMSKIFQKMKRKEMVDLNQNVAALRSQISSKRFTPDFLVRFEYHLRNLDTIASLRKKAHKDLVKVVGDVQKEVVEAEKAIATFLAIFKNVPDVQHSNLDEGLKRIIATREQINQAMSGDIGNIERVGKQLRYLAGYFRDAFNALDSYSKDMLSKINSSPEAAMKSLGV